jgi:hypothetical protein
MDYMLKRWESFGRFPNDGRSCLSNKLPNADTVAPWISEPEGCCGLAEDEAPTVSTAARAMVAASPGNITPADTRARANDA